MNTPMEAVAEALEPLAAQGVYVYRDVQRKELDTNNQPNFLFPSLVWSIEEGGWDQSLSGKRLAYVTVTMTLRGPTTQQVDDTWESLKSLLMGNQFRDLSGPSTSWLPGEELYAIGAEAAILI